MKRKTALMLSSPVLLILLGLAAQVRCDRSVGELRARYADRDSRFMKIRGMDVHYRDRGSGYPLVLLHGTASSLHTWDEWTKALVPKYRVIRMDLPAFGLTGPAPDHDYSMKSYIAFLDELLEKLDVKDCFMAGNSLGGRIAWEYALARPGRVRRLVLIDAAGYPLKQGMPLVFRLARLPLLGGIMRYVTPRFVVEKNVLEVYGDGRRVTDALVDRYYDMTLREGNRDAFIARSRIEYRSVPKEISSLSIPVLILWGRKDLWIPLENAHAFHRDIPGSKLIVYDGAGHVPMEEIPERTVGDAMEFLAH